jgi:1-aminocyclopropane-1-carboxylate deaminase/D-cysteine desulfhydrase-like pyridoxal-dependent ACC family enzyme
VWPTPLEPAPALGAALARELWIKREDRSAAAYGGSKVRGLEFLLADLAPGTPCVTVGATGSTHCLATTVHGRARGLRPVLAQFPQPETAPARAIAAAALRSAEVVVRARSRAGLPLAVVRAWMAARALGPPGPRWIPGGGAHPRAVLGHLIAALELGDQLPGGAAPDAVVLPLGSGGTAAGIGLGLAALGWPTRVVAVRVAPRLIANGWRVGQLARAARRLLARRGLRLPAATAPIVVEGLGAGYGAPSAEGAAASSLGAAHGLLLDATYGAKAFAFLLQRTSSSLRRVVFWHTFAAPPLNVEAMP